MDFKTDEIVSLLKEQLQNYNADIDVSEVGEITYVGDGVARVSGLENVMSSELVELPNDVFGMALNLETDNVGIVLLGYGGKRNWDNKVFSPGQALNAEEVGDEASAAVRHDA